MSELDSRIAAYKERQLDMCDQMLTDVGVPEWVTNGDSDVPGNSTPCRLRWFLARRKDVKPSEAETATTSGDEADD